MISPDPDAAAALAADLGSARYTVDRLRALWGDDAGAALERGNRVPALRALAASGTPDPAATLARLLLLGVPVSRADLDAALPTLGAAGLARLGVVALDGDRARPAVDLRPYAFVDARGAAQWWIASDLGEQTLGGPLPTDHVLGIGGASLTLAGLLLPGPAEGRLDAALDLGTGCGIQALHLARIARRVVATDISERALAFARLNAALNGVTSIEFRLGSFFEPVAGERFDRVVSNPPFVITPRRPDVPAYEYRDGGAAGDDVVRAMITGVAAHLEPGGVAQLLGNWEDRDVAGLDRARGWAEEAGLEYWIVQRDRLDPARYAETWIRDGGTRPGTPEGDPLVGAWLDDFAERGVVGVGVGYVLLRRPIGEPRLRRAEWIDAPLDDAAGGGIATHLAESLAAADALAALSDADLLGMALAVAPDVTEERSHVPGEEHPSVIVLRQGGGFRRDIRADPGLAAVVGASDGDLPLGAIIDAVAGLLDVDAGELTAALVPAIRELVAVGMLRLP